MEEGLQELGGRPLVAIRRLRDTLPLIIGLTVLGEFPGSQWNLSVVITSTGKGGGFVYHRLMEAICMYRIANGLISRGDDFLASSVVGGVTFWLFFLIFNSVVNNYRLRGHWRRRLVGRFCLIALSF